MNAINFREVKKGKYTGWAKNTYHGIKVVRSVELSLPPRRQHVRQKLSSFHVHDRILNNSEQQQQTYETDYHKLLGGWANRIIDRVGHRISKMRMIVHVSRHVIAPQMNVGPLRR